MCCPALDLPNGRRAPAACVVAQPALADNGRVAISWSAMTIISNGYRLLLRPLLFMMAPEAAQTVAEFALKRRLAWRLLSPAFRVRDARLRVSAGGLMMENPVGLAAGYDKNCAMLPSLGDLGFGYLLAGTVTESPQPGNPKPRLVRLAGEQSLLNALGFPNEGLESAARRLELARGSARGTPVVVSVSGLAAEEIVRCHRRLEPLADAIEVNISSPNTAGLRLFHEPRVLAELIDRVNERRSKPLWVKMPPYPAGGEGPRGSEGLDSVLALARVCMDGGVDAVTVANSRPTSDARLSTGSGGLSGKAVFPDTVRMVADIRAEVGGGLAINACGGIFSPGDAWMALRAGASTVQLYTGLVYGGPGVVRQINRGLLAIMEREGVESLRAADAGA